MTGQPRLPVQLELDECGSMSYYLSTQQRAWSQNGTMRADWPLDRARSSAGAGRDLRLAVDHRGHGAGTPPAGWLSGEGTAGSAGDSLLLEGVHLEEDEHWLGPDDTVVVATDRDGLVTWTGTGAVRTLGWTAQDLVGNPLTMSMFVAREHGPRPTGAGSPRDLGQILSDMVVPKSTTEGAHEAVSAGLWTVVHKDGRTSPVAMRVSPLTDGEERHLGFVVTAREVSERLRFQAMLSAARQRERAAIDRLDQLDRSKSDFVATVNHELRTPLTNIAGYLEILEDSFEAYGDGHGQLLEAMRRNCDRLASLVDNLLTVSGFDSDGVPAGVADVDLGKLLDHAARDIRPMADEKRLGLALDLSAEPIVVVGGDDHLRRVILNLLDNAVKFTDPGGSIRCVLRAGEGQALLSVSDDGMGVDWSEQEGLCTPFFRSSQAQARQIAGAGLGLAIAAAVVEAHHGSLAVQSEHLQGTTVTVRLPLRPVGHRRTLLGARRR